MGIVSSFRNTFGLQALLLSAAFTLPCRIAAADTGAPVDAAGAADTVEAPAPSSRASNREAFPLSAGFRTFTAPGLGVAGLGGGFDVAYSLRPELAVSAQYFGFFVDQGADPDYCERCIRSGSAGMVSAEGRLLPKAIVTPYGRAGFGLVHLAGQRAAYERGYTENDAALQGEVGVELHYRWASLRLFGFHLAMLGSELDADPFNAFGAQISGRF
jgi:hypothetical protein